MFGLSNTQNRLEITKREALFAPEMGGEAQEKSQSITEMNAGASYLHKTLCYSSQASMRTFSAIKKDV